MNFKLYFESTDYQHLFIAIQQIAQSKPRLAKPTTLLDSGMQGGYVFNTTDPNVVIRIGPSNEYEACEYTLADEDVQDSGGVVRIFMINNTIVDGENYVVTWKERVEDNVSGFLLRQHKDKYEEIGSILSALYHVDRNGLAILKNFPPTNGLVKAIYAGLPVSDLALDHNLGVTKDGRIVAYDC